MLSFGMFVTRVLGIDYGTVRVGLALSDEIGMLATPFETVERAKASGRIRQLIAEKNIRTLVVGMPRNMDGSYGPMAEQVRQFVASLTKGIEVEVKWWDERWSSVGVERMLIEADVSRKRRKEVIDKLVAQQLLQSYLDAQSPPL